MRLRKLRSELGKGYETFFCQDACVGSSSDMPPEVILAHNRVLQFAKPSKLRGVACPLTRSHGCQLPAQNPGAARSGFYKVASVLSQRERSFVCSQLGTRARVREAGAVTTARTAYRLPKSCSGSSVRPKSQPKRRMMASAAGCLVSRCVRLTHSLPTGTAWHGSLSF